MVFYRVLELAVMHEPVRYQDLILNPEPKKIPPAGRAGWGHPPSLDRPPANRPWRVARPGVVRLSGYPYHVNNADPEYPGPPESGDSSDHQHLSR
jgi:hypothetical protein